MEDTIFAPSFGNRPTILVGREPVLRELEDGLKTMPGSRERAGLLLGQRGAGKTVLLLEMMDLAQKAGYIVASPTVTATGMLDRIIEKLQNESGQLAPKKSVTGGSVGVLGFSAGVQFQNEDITNASFALKLSRICEQVNERGKGILILVDEVQAGHEELRQLVIAYQEMVGEGRNIALVLAGLPNAISSTLNDSVLTFLNRARRTWLEPLRIGDVEAFYRNAFKTLGVNILDEDIRYAAEKTEGSPYFMQLLGHEIAINAEPTGRLEEEDFQRAVLRASNEFRNDICQTLLNMLSAKDIEFLQAMSEDEGESKIAEIVSRMGVSSAYVQLYKKRMMDSGIIMQPRRGYIQFAVPYLL